MPTLIEHVFPLLILFIVMVAFVVYVFINTPKGYYLKWLAIPLILIGSVYSYKTYDQMLGYPVPIPLPKAFIYQSHKVVKGKNNQKQIEILENSLDDGDEDGDGDGKGNGNSKGGKKGIGQSRLHIVPWSQHLQEELDKAADRKNRTGVPQMFSSKKKSNSNRSGKGPGGEWDYEDLVGYDLPFEQVIRKGDPNEQIPPR